MHLALLVKNHEENRGIRGKRGGRASCLTRPRMARKWSSRSMAGRWRSWFRSQSLSTGTRRARPRNGLIEFTQEAFPARPEDQGPDQRGAQVLNDRAGFLGDACMVAFATSRNYGPRAPRQNDDRVKKTAVVPVHWILEVANGLRMAVRRRRRLQLPMGPAQVRLAHITRAAHHRRSGNGRDAAGRRFRRLRRLYGLTTYDAAYLELALRLDAPLATLDADLARAARAAKARLF